MCSNPTECTLVFLLIYGLMFAIACAADVCRRVRFLTMEHVTPTRLDADCVICLHGSGEEGVRLECGHAFHEACLSRWLRVAWRCPTCRAPIDVRELV